MNWPAIGAIGEVVGAAAVFISLLYLALQIRNSRRSDQILAATAAASAIRDWIGQIVRDETLYDLYRRGLMDYESLSRPEKGRYSMLLFQLFRAAETAWAQMQIGVVDPDFCATVQKILAEADATKLWLLVADWRLAESRISSDVDDRFGCGFNGPLQLRDFKPRRLVISCFLGGYRFDP